jgi:ATP-dependent RNA helicase SUPV3L1/SUV3
MAYGGAKRPSGRLILRARGAGSAVRRCSSKDVAVGHDRVQSLRSLKELVMVEVGPSSEEKDLLAEQPQPRHNFSVVQGFQVVGGEDHGAVQAGDQAWRDALRLELEARAARLHQAVDAAIVLSNDGIIRWLGDPVAKLSLGPDILNPSAVIFADESLPVSAREAVKTRIELWIAAMTRRILAPLFALEGIQEGSEIVRDLAHELVRSLGVLEREPIKGKIKTLAQDDRAELRKQGARFGAYYIFVPALLKPAPRTLALQLWSLQAPGDASELLLALGPVASSGRTSLPSDKGISKEAYRVAGYRPCGERIVRVDVVERLAGMIRAAIAEEPPGIAPGSHRTSKGFVVSGAMTSLTGCSGEQFASILRSMGFRSVEMKRSDFFGSQSANEAAGQTESPKPAEDRITDDQASPPAASDDEALADTVLPASPAEPPLDAVPEDVDTVLQGADVAAESADDLPEVADAVAEDGGNDAVPVDRATSGAADPSDGAPAVDAGARAVFPETSGARSEPAKNADMIVVWRPDRSRIAQNRRGNEIRHSTSGTPGRLDTDGHGPVPARKWARNKKKHAELPSPLLVQADAAHAPKSADRPDLVQPEEKRRQRPRNYDMPRVNTATAPQHKAKVDPNSPFAKLLELRSLLEKQANKRP